MTAPRTQSYANHRRFFALYHYVQGDNFDVGALSNALAKIEPLYYESLDSEE